MAEKKRRILLDTHALLWYHLGAKDLPTKTVALIANRTTEVYVSAVSAWEIGMKHSKGHLPEGEPFVGGWLDVLAAYQFIRLPISDLHSLMATGFAQPHLDPFDRLLAAQSLLEDLELVSLDDKLDQFGVRRVWER
jgi:PIN domain nuclease of toxin-antitoxin system